MDTVTVLLSVKDGAPYLPAQLQSLTAQRGVSWRLLWRDDGSGDDSAGIVRRFAAAATELPGGALGVAASYWALLHAAPDGVVAFCDQDDVWLPDKLARGCAALDAVEAGVPALYCARQTLVDAELRRIGASPAIPRVPVFPMPLAQNVATGCTVMLNAAAVALLRGVPAPLSGLHDWWCHVVIAAAGTTLVDPAEMVLYRQHGGNAVGAPRARLARMLAALRRGPGPFMAIFRGHVAGLLAQRTKLPAAAAAALDEIDRALQGGVAARARVLWRYRLRRQTPGQTGLFALWFLLRSGR